MKNEEQILKELQLFKNREKELIKEFEQEIKCLPDKYCILRCQNLINELVEINFKKEILSSVLI